MSISTSLTDASKPEGFQLSQVVTRIKRVNGYVGHHYQAYFGDFFIPFIPKQIEDGTDLWIQDSLPENASDDQITTYWNALAVSLNPADENCTDWEVRPSVRAMIEAADAPYGPNRRTVLREKLDKYWKQLERLGRAKQMPDGEWVRLRGIQGPMWWLKSPEDFSEFMTSLMRLEPWRVAEPWYTRLGGEYEEELPRKPEPKAYTAAPGTWHHDEGRSHIGNWSKARRGQFTDAELAAEVKAVLPNMENQGRAKLREYTEEFTRWGRNARRRDQETAKEEDAHKIMQKKARQLTRALLNGGVDPESVPAIVAGIHPDLPPDEIKNMRAEGQKQTPPATSIELKPWSIDGLVPLAERKIPERTWLIEDLIPKQSLVLMSALPGHGKSILAYAVGRAISEGRDFAGLSTQESPVLYIDRENDGAYWRSEIMKKLFQEDEGGNFYFNVGTDINQPPELNNLGLIAWVESCDPKPLIVVDSLSKYMVGLNENLAQDVDPWMTQAIALRNMGCTVLIIHHMGKQGTSRGSTAIVANVDWALDITRTEAIIPAGPDKGNKGMDAVQIVVSKGRGAHKDHNFKFDYVSHRFESTTRARSASKSIPGMETLLSENPGMSGSALVQLALAAKVASYRDARAWVSTNLACGLIRPEGKGSATRLYWRENEQPGRQGNLLEMPGFEDVPF